MTNEEKRARFKTQLGKLAILGGALALAPNLATAFSVAPPTASSGYILEGEFTYTTDTGQLFISAGTNNAKLPIMMDLGHDNRTGITGADASPITLYTTTAAGQLYRVSARILATAGQSASYTIAWTEGGASRSVVLNVTALGTEYANTFLIQPDSATAITAQVTAVTSSTVNVAASVEQMA